LALYGAIVLVARLAHRRVLYRPPAGPLPATPPDDAALLTLRAGDGVVVHALAVPATPTPGRRTVVYFHGNAEVADSNVGVARALRARGLDVVLVEYRGYGRSRDAADGPSERGLYLDAEGVLDALGASGVGKEQIVLWGQSLGTGVAAEMARRGRGARVVLVAPFTSTADVAAHVVPVLPSSIVMADRFDTIAKAKEILVPAIVAHGTADEVIPFAQGERVSRALPHATLVAVDGGRHMDLYEHADVFEALVRFATAP
jgi:pimeloyl-ACP methyl ester carboxylesterase